MIVIRNIEAIVYTTVHKTWMPNKKNIRTKFYRIYKIMRVLRRYSFISVKKDYSIPKLTDGKVTNSNVYDIFSTKPNWNIYIKIEFQCPVVLNVKYIIDCEIIWKTRTFVWKMIMLDHAVYRVRPEYFETLTITSSSYTWI